MAAVLAGYRDVNELANEPFYEPGPPSVVSEEAPLQATRSSRPLNRKEILILVACSCSSTFMHMGISTIPLLLPPEIIRKHIPYEYCGMIFSVFAISIVIFEPLQAKILPIIGTKIAFCFSSFLGGVCYISLAFLDYAYTTAGFVAPAMIIRFIEGFYYAMLITASNVTVCLAFPDRASFAFGILEGFVGAGFTLGPLLGGTLYKYGGFIAPFLTYGVLLLFTSVLGYFALEQVTGLNLTAKPKERSRLIRDPAFIGCAMLIFAMGICWGIFETALEPALAAYDEGPIIEGVVFAIAYLSYAGMSPFWGFVFRKVHIDYRWILLGPIAVGIWWMIMGPVPIFSAIDEELWLDMVCLILINASVAYVFVFGYDTMLKRAIFCGLEENVATYAMVVAGFFTSLYMGEVVGPVIGGYIMSQLSFPIVAVAAATIAFIMTLIAAITMLIKWERLVKWARKKLNEKFPSYFSAPDSQEEYSPLNSGSHDGSSHDEDLSIFQPPSVSRQTGALKSPRRISTKDSAYNYGSFGQRNSTSDQV